MVCKVVITPKTAKQSRGPAVAPNAGKGAAAVTFLGDAGKGVVPVLLGHALGLAAIAYIVVLYHQQIRVYPLFRQALVIGSLIFLYTLSMLLIYNLLGSLRYGYENLLAALTSAILWPWVFIVLRDFRRKTVVA